jgi:transmembrane 9 superfamily protein 3
VGTGIQMALLCIAVIGLTIAGNFFEERGTILTAFLVTYALTSFVGGWVDGTECVCAVRADGPPWTGV